MGLCLRPLREKAGLSMMATAKALGVTHPAYIKWETGQGYPSADKLPQLAGLAPLGCWHLCNKSSIAADTLPQAVCALVHLVTSFVRDAPPQLLHMAADGRIDEMEREDYDQIMLELDRIVAAALQLKYAEGGGE